MRRELETDPLSSVNLLDLAPVRAARWETAGERVVIHRPPPTARGLRGIAQRLASLWAPPRIRLDSAGTFAWKRFDGEATVGEVAEALRGRFGGGVEPAEQRLGVLVRFLRREGLLVYPGWDPSAAPADAAETR